jgi:hypothetical protein
VKTKCAVLVTLLTASGAAAAQSATERQVMAAQLFDDAERLMAARQAADACPNYAESYRLDPQLGSLLHLAECYAAIGRTASAWANFRDALDLAAARADARTPRIRERIAELERALPRVVLEVSPAAPPDLQINQDGNPVRRIMWGEPTPVDPGDHVLSARALGRKNWVVTIRIPAASSTTRVAIPDLSPQMAALPPTFAAPKENVDAGVTRSGPSTRAATQRIIGWSAVGAGAVAIGVGVAFEVVRGNKIAESNPLCPKNECGSTAEAQRYHSLISDAKAAAAIGAAGLIAGGVLAAGGVVLVLTAPGERGTSTSVRPLVGPGVLGATLTARAF